MDDSERGREFMRQLTDLEEQIEEEVHVPVYRKVTCQGCDADLEATRLSTVKPGYCAPCVEGSGNRAARRVYKSSKNLARMYQ